MKLFTAVICLISILPFSSAFRAPRPVPDAVQKRQAASVDGVPYNVPNLPATLPPSQAPKAKLKNGTYYGLHSTIYNQDFFLGVPFAQPPVDDLRYRVPASLNATWTTPRNATVYSPACYGYGEDTIYGGANYVSEDCLTLNIIRPSGYEDQDLPVGFWIYGGGFYEGSNRDQRYNLSFIVDQSVKIGKPIIGVSINYRLSWFGWLWSEEVVKQGVANLGLRDQHMALRWVNENIGAFGGDPNKVTIWGESAGAISVGLNLLAYNGRDDKLFRGAIAESGDVTGLGMINAQPSTANRIYHDILNKTSCTDANDPIQCLREIPVKKLSNIFNNTVPEGYYSLHVGPLVDGDIIARPGLDQMREGDFIQVPFILGENSDDGTDFVPFGLNSNADVFDFYEPWGFSNSTIEKILELYPNDPVADIPLSVNASFGKKIGTQFQRAATITGDIAFKATRRLNSRLWVNHTKAPLWSYRFNAILNGIPNYFGVTHWQEIPFVFHNTDGIGFPDIDPPYFGPDPFANRSQSFFELADLVSRMWVSFIHDGKPNFEGQKAVKWPAYELVSPSAYVFDANVSSYVEQDTYREEGIQWIIDQYLGGGKPWARHDGD